MSTSGHLNSRAVLSPVPVTQSSLSSNPHSPAMNISGSRETFASSASNRCYHCNQSLSQINVMPSPSPPLMFSPGSSNTLGTGSLNRGKSPSQERFLKPAAPPPP
ncbi:hypothetical protein TNCT_392791 [Trichonephila clavata]|nr:hypothetical protein TNCT_392791 [Trichonephila clavata]